MKSGPSYCMACRHPTILLTPIRCLQEAQLLLCQECWEDFTFDEDAQLLGEKLDELNNRKDFLLQFSCHDTNLDSVLERAKVWNLNRRSLSRQCREHIKKWMYRRAERLRETKGVVRDV